MKTNTWIKITGLSALVALTSLSNTFAQPGRGGGSSRGGDMAPRYGDRMAPPPMDAPRPVDRWLDRLEERDPAEHDRLIRLREEDPAAFRQEVRLRLQTLQQRRFEEGPRDADWNAGWNERPAADRNTYRDDRRDDQRNGFSNEFRDDREPARFDQNDAPDGPPRHRRLLAPPLEGDPEIRGLVREWRNSDNPAERDALRAEIRQRLEQAFEAHLMAQRQELERASQRLRQLEGMIDEQENRREQWIDRRLESLDRRRADAPDGDD
jgi:hypothetical protein